MKPIKEQYKLLKENKMSQAQFMRNIRLTLPHLVTNITGYKDAIRILHNKGIISETYEDMKNHHPYELRLGTEEELESKPDQDIDKVLDKISKKLDKDPNFYTNQLAGKKKTKKDTDQREVEVKKNFTSKNQMEKTKIKVNENKIRAYIRKVILENNLVELSADTIKSYHKKTYDRGELTRGDINSDLFFNKFKGKSIFGGVITSINMYSEGGYYAGNGQGYSGKLGVNVKLPNSRSSVYKYDIEEDQWEDIEEYPIYRTDARILSLIAKHINPDTKYGNGSQGFNIKGYK